MSKLGEFDINMVSSDYFKTDKMACPKAVGVADDIHAQSIEGGAKLCFSYLPAAQWSSR